MALAGANAALAGQPPAGPDDGILTAAEAADMALVGTRLVVVSACDSGLGDVGGGFEGVYGLRRAFIHAGARNLVLSLWAVEDRAGARLIDAMYAGIVAGESPQRALLRAQRDYLAAERRAGRWPHPFFWSALVVNGRGPALEGP